MSQTVSLSNPNQLVDEESKIIDLPYSFAKRNGVVLQRDKEGKPVVHYKKGLKPAIANEVNRVLQTKVSFKLIENDDFERLLARQYIIPELALAP